MSTFLNLFRSFVCRKKEDVDATNLAWNRFQDPSHPTTTTAADYTQIPSYEPHPRTISPPSSTSFINQLNAQTTAPTQSPVSSAASNTSTTRPAAAKPRIKTPKRHPQPHVSVANSRTTTPSAVAKRKTKTPKSSHHPPPSRQDSLASSSSSS
ncbi:hypothetical protein LguiB_021656 [Lonicera macranthoides]